MRQYRTLSDGSRLYRDYVSCPEGYEEDPEDGRRFLLKYEPCIYREQNKRTVLPCGRCMTKDHCILKKVSIDRLYCSTCQERSTSDVAKLDDRIA